MIMTMKRFCRLLAVGRFSCLAGSRNVWNTNKNTIVTYTPTGKDLKIIWEQTPSTQWIINLFKSLRTSEREESSPTHLLAK